MPPDHGQAGCRLSECVSPTPGRFPRKGQYPSIGPGVHTKGSHRRLSGTPGPHPPQRSGRRSIESGAGSNRSSPDRRGELKGFSRTGASSMRRPVCRVYRSHERARSRAWLKPDGVTVWEHHVEPDVPERLLHPGPFGCPAGKHKAGSRGQVDSGRWNAIQAST